MSERKRYVAQLNKVGEPIIINMKTDVCELILTGSTIVGANLVADLLNAQAEQIEQLAAALKPFANIYELFVSEVIASGGDPRFLTDFSKWWQQKRDGTDYFLLERAREALAALKV